MITRIIKVKGGEYAIDPDGRIRAVETLYGLSSDEKPTEGVNDADRFYEKDTHELSTFDEENKKWWPM